MGATIKGKLSSAFGEVRAEYCEIPHNPSSERPRCRVKLEFTEIAKGVTGISFAHYAELVEIAEDDFGKLDRKSIKAVEAHEPGSPGTAHILFDVDVSNVPEVKYIKITAEKMRSLILR